MNSGEPSSRINVDEEKSKFVLFSESLSKLKLKKRNVNTEQVIPTQPVMTIPNDRSELEKLLMKLRGEVPRNINVNNNFNININSNFDNNFNITNLENEEKIIFDDNNKLSNFKSVDENKLAIINRIFDDSAIDLCKSKLTVPKSKEDFFINKDLNLNEDNTKEYSLKKKKLNSERTHSNILDNCIAFNIAHTNSPNKFDLNDNKKNNQVEKLLVGNDLTDPVINENNMFKSDKDNISVNDVNLDIDSSNKPQTIDSKNNLKTSNCKMGLNCENGVNYEQVLSTPIINKIQKFFDVEEKLEKTEINNPVIIQDQIEEIEEIKEIIDYNPKILVEVNKYKRESIGEVSKSIIKNNALPDTNIVNTEKSYLKSQVMRENPHLDNFDFTKSENLLKNKQIERGETKLTKDEKMNISNSNRNSLENSGKKCLIQNKDKLIEDYNIPVVITEKDSVIFDPKEIVMFNDNTTNFLDCKDTLPNEERPKHNSTIIHPIDPDSDKVIKRHYVSVSKETNLATITNEGLANKETVKELNKQSELQVENKNILDTISNTNTESVLELNNKIIIKNNENVFEIEEVEEENNFIPSRAANQKNENGSNNKENINTKTMDVYFGNKNKTNNKNGDIINSKNENKNNNKNGDLHRKNSSQDIPKKTAIINKQNKEANPETENNIRSGGINNPKLNVNNLSELPTLPKEGNIPIDLTQENQDFPVENTCNNLINIDEQLIVNATKRITKFDKIEINYNETVSDFSTIFREKNYIFLKRREAVIKNEYYQDYILKENNILDKYRKLPHSYVEILEESLKSFQNETNFNSIFQDVIGDDNNHKGEMIKLLEANKNRQSGYKMIENLKPIENYFIKYKTGKTDGVTFQETIKDVAAYRIIHCDGDSFYRAFMFGLFEWFILSKNLHEIKKLILDIYRIFKNPGATLFKTRIMDFNKALIVFHLIIENLSSGNVQKAYNSFVSAFELEDHSFDLVLIGYMRLILWLNISELQNSVTKLKKQSSDKITSKTANSNNNLEYEEINVDTFLVYQNEPSKLALTLIPHVFNVCLDLYVYDGGIVDNKTTINLKKHKFNQNSLNQDNLPLISISFSLSSYFKFYPRKFFDKHKNILNKMMELEKSSTGPAVMVNSISEFCEKCNSNMLIIVLTRYSVSACLTCVQKYIKETIEKRAEIYNKENFINREYYSRSLELKEKIFLDDFDVIEITGSNISSLLWQMMCKICFSCDKIISEDLCILECKCQLCKECLNKYVIQATQGEMILNKFEKKRANKITCCCNLPFNIDNALAIINSTQREYREKAIKRLEYYTAHICMICTSPLISEDEELEVGRTTDAFFRVRILEENIPGSTMKDFAKTPHLICFKCADKIMANDKKNKGKNSENFKIIGCRICEDDHLIEEKEWSLLKKRNCCQGQQCVIY